MKAFWARLGLLARGKVLGLLLMLLRRRFPHPTKAALGGAVHPKVVYLCASLLRNATQSIFLTMHTGNKTLVSYYVVLGMQRIVFNISLALDTQTMRYYFCFYEILGFLCAFLTRHFSCKLLCITRMLELVLSSGAKQC